LGTIPIPNPIPNRIPNPRGLAIATPSYGGPSAKMAAAAIGLVKFTYSATAWSSEKFTRDSLL